MRNTQVFLLLVLFSACAVVVHPSGGPKDETPPQIRSISIDSNEVNFNDDRITINFDEYVQIEDQNNILISPPLETKPDFSIKGKSLVIRFKERLRDSVTYSLQLNTAIKDNNEGNILPNYKIKWSTGPQLDTLQLQGRVENALTREPGQSFTVALFNPNASAYPDSLIYPLYITRTNASGQFSFDGLKTGSYSLYTFKDVNSNYRFETGEEVGYLDSTIHIPDTNSYTLYTAPYSLQTTHQLSAGHVFDYRQFTVAFKNHTSSPLRIRSEKTVNDKSHKVYYRSLSSDSLLVYDAYKQVEDTTLTYYFDLADNTVDSLTIDFTRQPILHLYDPLRAPIKLDPRDTLQIQTRQPLVHADPSRIHLIKDSSDHIPFKIASATYSAFILFQREEGSRYRLILDSAAILTLESTNSQADTMLVRTAPDKNFGNLQISWTGDSSLIYQVDILKSKEEDPILSIRVRGLETTIQSLPVAEYLVRVRPLNSLASNRIIPFKQQVQPFYYHPTKVKLRGNWTVGDILINTRP